MKNLNFLKYLIYSFIQFITNINNEKLTFHLFSIFERPVGLIRILCYYLSIIFLKTAEKLLIIFTKEKN